MKKCLLLITTLSLAFQLSAQTYEVPRLADGSPDLQGIWRNSTATPMQRDLKLGNRRAFSAEEAAAIREAALAHVAADAVPTDPNAPAPNAEPLPPVGNYNLFWTDRGMNVAEINGEYRTSMIIEPKNGRIPALTDAARARQSQLMMSRNGSEGPEARSLGERCILSFGSASGPPMLPVMYNSHYQIVQAPGYVMILVEMVHDVRLIRIDDKPLPETIKQWMGDSVGYYEGDTLVVKTKNFRPEQSFLGSSDNMVVTEYFTRVAEDTFNYRFRIDDPDAFVAPIVGELPFTRSDETIYEYACHEGNYGMEGILGGARRLEREGKTR